MNNAALTHLRVFHIRGQRGLWSPWAYRKAAWIYARVRHLGPVMVSLMCQLGWTIAPNYLLKNKSRCFCGGILQMW